MKKMAAIFLCILLGISNLCRADMFKDYIEYRYQPKLGKVTIISNLVRGVEYVDYLSDNWQEVAEQNIFVVGTAVDEKRVFKRSDEIDEYKIDTVLTLYPAKGYGVGGANPLTTALVTINGKKKIDCNIGYLPRGSKEVKEIMICPEDDYIRIDAFDHIKGQKICEQCIYVSDNTIITNEYIRTST
ncbi:hypothetical protein KJ641_00015 [Patescibacteria group bacterium]|nr:hypothetical protein [Patescibacteria group bacterium]